MLPVALLHLAIIDNFRQSFMSTFSCEGVVAPLLRRPGACYKSFHSKGPRVQHRRWIDLFPSPQLRDNILMSISQGRPDIKKFYEDVIGHVFEDCECSDQEPFPVEPVDP
jgi:hypothetical protein